MKKITLLVMAILALVLFGAMPSYADRGGGHFHDGGHFHGGGHFGFGVVIGPGWGWPYYGYPYPYYSAPPVVIESQPDVYVSPQPQPQSQSYWYYCSDPSGYYPQVQRCPKGWMKVLPDPGAGPE
jgi:hypothetical protein